LGVHESCARLKRWVKKEKEFSLWAKAERRGITQKGGGTHREACKRNVSAASGFPMNPRKNALPTKDSRGGLTGAKALSRELTGRTTMEVGEARGREK